MSEQSTKAYVVYRRGDEGEEMTIVFAASSSAAKQQLYAMVDCPWVDLRVRREAWADAYAEDDSIPIRAYLENGWWMLCVGVWCGHRVDLETLGGLDKHDRPLCIECAEARGETVPEWALAGKAEE